MIRSVRLFLALGLGIATLSACQTAPAGQPKPVAGFVTDMKAFDVFIATKPTAEQFHAAYPDVTLVTPDMMTTREMRQNNSRYFPKMDADGRIVGGSFQ
ncbi:hypothetical protein SAMN02800694_1516 [Luteibacter sp. UNCMF331Sha3.1]|uniref:hypothetical protein n=1 Tax=Luteibacter sp. UNCMF331Sha3.1 TaxID=1502760 RepID=UPI0008B5DD46|nr:hypothetical protein [Luteibacter sp. UNCMF331Sha3.1]SEM56102.1 hypothetical protein SAMN02800694_1516 [Luteibacter sp. UNCMF331Sha3.1]